MRTQLRWPAHGTPCSAAGFLLIGQELVPVCGPGVGACDLPVFWHSGLTTHLNWFSMLSPNTCFPNVSNSRLATAPAH